MRAILTVIGKDKVGIVYEVSKICANAKVNILDINQTLMEEYFTMVVLLDFENSEKSLLEVQNDFTELGKKLNVDIKLQNEEIFNNIYNI